MRAGPSSAVSPSAARPRPFFWPRFFGADADAGFAADGDGDGAGFDDDDGFGMVPR